MSISEEIERIGEVRKLLFTEGGQTNADHIRSMTDEELADFLADATYKENEQGYTVMRTVNKVWWHKWLKQPFKE